MHNRKSRRVRVNHRDAVVAETLSIISIIAIKSQLIMQLLARVFGGNMPSSDKPSGLTTQKQTRPQDANMTDTTLLSLTRRGVLLSGSAVAATALTASFSFAAKLAASTNTSTEGNKTMGTITTKDGVEIFYKDWGSKDAQPIVFHHGWPLSSDDWDAQMLFFLANGYRVIAHDRRGHGRSAQVSDGHDMDHYAADAFAVVEALDLKNAVHIGHSTGGGEVARYVAMHGQPAGRVAKAVLVSAVPPLMLKTDANPEGLPMEVFDGFRSALAANRAQFFRDVPAGPFYGFNRDDAKVQEGVIQNWWRQGMMGGAKAHYDGIKAFSETDQTEDLKTITVPTLVLHGEDDQIVPIADAALKAIKLLKNGTLKTYPGFSHGMLTVNADVLNADLLAFVKS
ncbi:non-heme haloperoxidase [Allorhizobium ampelinum S4]|uniref:Non-heme haloperoxidase n=3 Tax=Rhizobiaceae TaxID=82115 RepID=B9K093_ALLAM|nr:non-heme haloperoxidase [Allorhizobium ampelinum S4]